MRRRLRRPRQPGRAGTGRSTLGSGPTRDVSRVGLLAAPSAARLLDLERRSGFALEHATELEQLSAYVGEPRGVRPRAVLPARAGGGAQASLGTLDGVALGVEQAADLEQRLDVLAAVEAMPG